MSTDPKSTCDNCGKKWDHDELHVPENLFERLTPGAIVPSGECPTCGCLAYQDGSTVPTLILGESLRTEAILVVEMKLALQRMDDDERCPPRYARDVQRWITLLETGRAVQS